jgi:large subunit ribosomal protein L3
MIKTLWGRKIGMTQKFASNNKVIPVTVVKIWDWKILQRKTTGHDGYEAIQIGCLRNRYAKLPFTLEWLKNKKKYFLFVREVRCNENDIFEIGSSLLLDNIFSEGEKISVTGKTIGKGFQGCVKRHGFAGGRASHGDKLGRKPGSLSGLRTQGFVSKGKKLPGHDGVETKTISNLKVVEFLPTEGLVIVKGAIPGKSGSLVRIAGGL